MAQLKHNEFVGYHIYETHRALSRSLEATLAPFGVTPGEWNALNQLKFYGSLTQKSLAEVLQKEQATITRTIDRMVKKGLVTREPDPNDRRANIITPTPLAKKLLRDIEPITVESAASAVSGIPEDELRIFYRTLERIKLNAEPDEEALPDAVG